MGTRVEHIKEGDVARDLSRILEGVLDGAEFVIERDAKPIAVIRAAPADRSISESIALAKMHEEQSGRAPVLDADFAADVGEIVRNRQPWNPPSWD